jgi:hypothetical protein
LVRPRSPYGPVRCLHLTHRGGLEENRVNVLCLGYRLQSNHKHPETLLPFQFNTSYQRVSEWSPSFLYSDFFQNRRLWSHSILTIHRPINWVSIGGRDQEKSQFEASLSKKLARLHFNK